MVDKFPDTLYVAIDPNSESDPVAYRAVEEAVDGDGPTVVAEYQLVRTRRFRKNTVEVGAEKKG